MSAKKTSNEAPRPRLNIFDRVYRIIVQRLPQFVISTVNEVFHTHYPPDAPCLHIRNEYITKLNKIITDSVILIGEHYYHLECQSTPDGTMALRMFEYDFAVALEKAWATGKPYKVKLPRSAVIYLRQVNDMPDKLDVELELADGKTITYTVPVVKVQQYSLANILERNLLLFLPYYIMRYEKELDRVARDNEKRQTLLSDMSAIADYLEGRIKGDDHTYADLARLVVDVTDYVLRKHAKIRKEAREIMYERRIELPSETIFRWGERKGLREGELKRSESIAISLLRDNMATEVVAKYTKLPKKRIAELKASL